LHAAAIRDVLVSQYNSPMLPKRRRLSAKEVRDIIAGGRSARASLLSAKYINGGESLRAAVVVSKKISKKAVIRNRVRRAVYRALSSYNARGVAVIFVQKVPEGALTPAFSGELMVLLSKLT
jgi:ribonuclease P protein component